MEQLTDSILAFNRKLNLNLTLFYAKSNPTYFTRGGGIYAPPREFALAEPKMHQNLCQFIHIKFEQFVGHRKRKQHFKSKNVVVAAKKKNCGVKCEEKIRPFQNASSKVGKFFLVKTKLTTPKC